MLVGVAMGWGWGPPEGHVPKVWQVPMLGPRVYAETQM